MTDVSPIYSLVGSSAHCFQLIKWYLPVELVNSSIYTCTIYDDSLASIYCVSCTTAPSWERGIMNAIIRTVHEDDVHVHLLYACTPGIQALDGGGVSPCHVGV